MEIEAEIAMIEGKVMEKVIVNVVAVVDVEEAEVVEAEVGCAFGESHDDGLHRPARGGAQPRAAAIVGAEHRLHSHKRLRGHGREEGCEG